MSQSHPNDLGHILALIEADERCGGNGDVRRRLREAVEQLGGDLRRQAETAEERVRVAVEAERGNAALLRAISESTGDVIFAKDREGRLTYANPATLALAGKPAGQVLGRTDLEILEDKGAARSVMANDRRIMECGVAEDLEEVVPLPDGTRRVWFSRKVPYRDAAGRVVGLLGVSRDITERKRAEEGARELQRKLDAALLAGEVGTFEWHVTEDRLWGDRNFERIFGIQLDASGAAPLAAYVSAIHPEDRARVIERVTRTVETGCGYEAEYRVVGAGGEVRWAVARGVGERDASGRVVRFPGVIVDITDRKRGEEALREVAQELGRQTRLFDGVAATTPDFIYVFDLGGRFLYANRRLLDVWGLRLEDIVGKTCLELGYERWHHDMHMREIAQVIETKRPIKGEVPFTAPLTGISGVYEYIFSPVLGPDGEVEVIAGTTRDITERKRTEEAAAEARRKLDAALIAGEVGTFEWDVAGERVWGDANFARMFGVAVDDRGAAALADYVAVIHPDDRARVTAAIGHTARTGAEYEIEYRVVSAGGQTRWLLVRAKPERDERGRVVRCSGVVLDVTDRKRAEEALRESEGRFRSVLAGLSEGLMLFDAGMNLIYQNPASLRIHGFAGRDEGRLGHEELPGKWEAWDEEGQGVRFDGWPVSRVFRGERFQGQVLRVRRVETGQEFYGSYNGSPIYGEDGRIRLGFITIREITAEVRARDERRRAEEALRESERRFRQLADAVPQIVWVTRPDGYHEYYNRRWYEYTGVAEGLTDGEGWNAIFHPDDRDRAWERWRHSLATGEPYEIEYRLRRHDGVYRWTLGRAMPIRNDRGEIERWFGTCTDIDDAKRVQAELERAKRSAEEASRAKDHFLAMLSHELRTPLTPALLTASAIEADPGTPEAIREQAGVVRRHVELEKRLIDDLLDLTRITEGKLVLHTKPVDVHDVLGHAVETCASALLDKRLPLVFRLEAGRRVVDADPVRLQQVFWNLLTNAVKFTPQGGQVVLRSWDGEDGRVRVSVTDNGAGIPRSALRRVFNAFEQLDDSVTRQFGGLGMGLTITRGLVEMHGGTVTAESEGPGRGATFTVSLPVTAGVAAGPAAAAPADRAGNGTAKALRILLVEDHPATARVLGRLLSGMGHEVVHADSVASALDAAGPEGAGFDVLLSDVGLPDGTGHDVMRAMRGRLGIGGIAMTGYGMEQDVQKSQEAGFAQHLVKPISVDQLQAALTRWAKEGRG